MRLLSSGMPAGRCLGHARPRVSDFFSVLSQFRYRRHVSSSYSLRVEPAQLDPDGPCPQSVVPPRRPRSATRKAVARGRSSRPRSADPPYVRRRSVPRGACRADACRAKAARLLVRSLSSVSQPRPSGRWTRRSRDLGVGLLCRPANTRCDRNPFRRLRVGNRDPDDNESRRDPRR